MGILDRRFDKKESKLKRNYEIDDTLYQRLQEQARLYDATLTDLINVCIQQLIETENITLFEQARHDASSTHSLSIRESNLAGLENLKDRFGVSIYKLVNIAIKNVLDELEP